MNQVYEVERRGNNYAVYNLQGSKVASFSTRKEAQAKADQLNNKVNTNIKN